MSNHRRPTMPASMKGKAQVGTCRWCALPILEGRIPRVMGHPTSCAARRAKRLTWHPACVTIYRVACFSGDQRSAVKRRDHGICALCGKVDPFWEADHIKPLIESEGRLEYFLLSNLRTLCEACHKGETKALAGRRAAAKKAARVQPAAAEIPLTPVPIREWHGCYGLQWKGLVPEGVFKHPAKYAFGLIRRIYQDALSSGRLHDGDLVGDPFGGVALGGWMARRYGIRWIGLELEPAFVATGMEVLWQQADMLRRAGRHVPPASLHLGDSRGFAPRVEAIITSPPYGESDQNYDRGRKSIDFTKGTREGTKSDNCSKGSYGAGDDQIGGLRQGTVEAVVTSVPFGEAKGGGGILRDGYAGTKRNDSELGTHYTGHEADRHDTNIEKLPQGTVDVVLTSPPWEDNAQGHVGAEKWGDPKKAAEAMSANGKGNYASPEARLAQFERDKAKHYGTADGQIGRAAGETYWGAMKMVYSSCFQAIRPGGFIFVVVKDYVKRKQRVCLCDDTQRLLEACGFVPIERIHAMLVKDEAHDDLFEGTIVKRTSQKSFFRRLCESKGAPEINFEEVIICQKQA